ncbi:terpene synthase family protein [Kitasatospora sp. NPDC001175]
MGVLLRRPPPRSPQPAPRNPQRHGQLPAGTPGVAATTLPLSLGERAAGIAVPAVAFHSPQLRRMRDIAVDVTFMCNDVYSLEKEGARGDMDNLVLVLEHERALTRADALTAARDEVDRRINDFQRLAAEVPGMCDRLGLDDTRRATIDTYIRVMGAWIGGYHAWQTQTARYRTALDILPRSGPATSTTSSNPDPQPSGPPAASSSRRPVVQARPPRCQRATAP